MRLFTDASGRQWPISVNVFTVERVRGKLGIDLLAVLDDKAKLYSDLCGNLILVANVVHCICEPDIEKSGISKDEFGRGLYGDAILSAQQALLEEIADFFPDAMTRATLKNVIAKGRAAQQSVIKHVAAKVEAVNPDSIAAAVIAGFTNLPESLESTPAPSP